MFFNGYIAETILYNRGKPKEDRKELSDNAKEYLAKKRAEKAEQDARR